MTTTIEGEARLVLDRLRIRQVEWWGLLPSTRGVIRKACLSKVAVEAKRARETSRRARSGGTNLRGYRCPFGHDSHFHLGRVPSMETVASIALAIRDLHGDSPAKSNRG